MKFYPPAAAVRAALSAFLFLTVSLSSANAVSAAATDTVAAYPAKPARFIVPFVAGAGTDATGRVIAAKLSELWGPAGGGR